MTRIMESRRERERKRKTTDGQGGQGEQPRREKGKSRGERHRRRHHKTKKRFGALQSSRVCAATTHSLASRKPDTDPADREEALLEGEQHTKRQTRYSAPGRGKRQKKYKIHNRREITSFPFLFVPFLLFVLHHLFFLSL